MGVPTWVVLANEGRARILALPDAGSDLEDVDELVDDAARADNADFRRDAYGRRAGSGAQENEQHDSKRFHTVPLLALITREA